MFILIFTLLFATLYLGAGTKYSRHRYAQLKAAPVPVKPPLDRLVQSRDRLYTRKKGWGEAEKVLVHASACDAQNWTSEGMRSYHCTCGAVTLANSLSKQIIHYDEPVVLDEPSVVPPLLFWPGYAAVGYMKSGVPQAKVTSTGETVAEFTERVEKELGFK